MLKTVVVAIWYQALAYLQVNEEEKAKSNFEIILKERYKTSERVVDLLEKME